MKNHAKVGGRKGRPAYRTPSHFRFNTKNRVVKAKFSGKKGYGRVH
ncbi:MAG: hypothetical protein HZB09_01000 [Candidatus Yonathbacteria bacterium]|nr:hypothetical protein [Candidatus Yonathbacteria bacterium]